MKSSNTSIWPLAQCLVLVAGIFAFDTLIPIGVAGAVAYVAVVLASVNLTDGRFTFSLAIGCAALAVLRIFLPSGQEGFDFWEVLTNRLLAVFAIWVTAALGLEWKRSQDALQNASDELEGRVVERTAALSQANDELVTQIAERERVEKTGRELEDRTAVIVEHAIDAIVLIDPDGFVVSWNPRAESMFGWSRQDVLGESLAELIIPEKHRQDVDMARLAQPDSDPQSEAKTEMSALHRDGHEFPIELYVKSVPWGDAHLFIAFARELEQTEKTNA